VNDELFAWYERHGRRHLPWRQTRDPYAIVTSEFMLQQTQVDRVLPLYRAFHERFPTFEALASADAGDVVRAWRGLGYNSRATRLHRLARTVVSDFGGVLPRERAALLALPGIGPYTVAAIRAFAFDEPDAALDTNIRRIVHRVAFGLEYSVRASEREIDARANASVPPLRGHDWNSAMMDLGATICTARAPKCLVCPLRDACAAAPVDAARLTELARGAAKKSPQEALPFERTVRFVRGRIVDRLRDVPAGDVISLLDLQDQLASVVPDDRLAEIPSIVDALVKDGIVVASERGIALGAAT
jgi:A/G-specific adenine glycosylase